MVLNDHRNFGYYDILYIGFNQNLNPTGGGGLLSLLDSDFQNQGYSFLDMV